jgi:RNA polymerase sigma-70 factor (ECF subfamily)
MHDEDSNSVPAKRGHFATTRWSVVLAAGQSDSGEAKDALATLCETYWYPLYAYVRRQGYDCASAQDLTQGFFARLLEKEDLRNVSRERGRFRSFLLASLKHYLINEWDRARAEKRGGGRVHLSLDFDSAESRYRLEPADRGTPETLYARHWALTLLDRVQELLRQEAIDAGKAGQFEQLRVFLTGSGKSESYKQAAEQLGMTEGAVKTAVHRLRRRFRERLRGEIAQTVTTEEDIDDEIHHLFEVLRG